MKFSGAREPQGRPAAGQDQRRGAEEGGQGEDGEDHRPHPLRGAQAERVQEDLRGAVGLRRVK